MRTTEFVRRVLLVACLLSAGTAHAKGPSYSDFVLEPSFPPLTPEQKSLTEVAGAKGAPAVVLLQAQQVNQELDLVHAQLFRIEFVRRVKILTQAGVERYSDFERVFFGDWRIQKIQARTVLPDGSEVSAKDTAFEEATAKDKGEHTAIHSVKIAFPKVQVGAILDVHLSLVADGVPNDRWIIQDRIPVVESRYLLVIPDNLQMKISGFFLTPEEQKDISGRSPKGRYFAWRFANEPAIPDEPNQPPLSDIAKALVITAESFKNENIYLEFAASWGSWAKDRKESLDGWLKGKSEALTAFAKQVTAGAESPTDKAEKIRQALRSRITFEGRWWGRTSETPDETLAQTHGTAGDLAGLAVAMLKAVGITAVPVVFRDRDDGILPKNAPLVPLLNDVVVRYPGAKGPEYLSPTADVPAGVLPREARGVWAMPIDGAAKEPELLPDFTAAENRAMRVLRASLTASGGLSGEVRLTLSGIRGEEWRSFLKSKDDDAKKDWIRRRLDGYLPGVQLSDLSFEALDDGAKDLVVDAKIAVEHFATVAGKRIIANLNVFERERAADWAASSREYPVDLDGAFESIDSVMVSLPPETANATVPTPPADYNAGNVGRYTASYESRGSAVVLSRRMRLDLYRFPATAYAGLKRWFGDIAAMDDRPVIVTLK